MENKDSMINHRLLIESEIEKLKNECSKMYLSIIMKSEDQFGVCLLEYEAKRDKLTALHTELILICHAISEFK